MNGIESNLGAFLVAAMCSTTVAAQTAEKVAQPEALEAGSVAFPGQYSVTEIIASRLDHYARSTDFGRDPVDYRVEIEIPLIEQGVQRVPDLSGLPIDPKKQRDGVRFATIMLPFRAGDHVQEGVFDRDGFVATVEQAVGRLRADSTSSTEQSNATTQDALDQPNCSGYPSGTRITETWVACTLGTTDSTYACMSHPSTGGNDWFLVDSAYLPPSESCEIGGR